MAKDNDGHLTLACVFCFTNGETIAAFTVVSGYAMCKIHFQQNIKRDKKTGRPGFKI